MNEKTLKVLEWQSIIESLKTYAITAKGKLRCDKIQFYTNFEKIKQEQYLTGFLKEF